MEQPIWPDEEERDESQASPAAEGPAAPTADSDEPTDDAGADEPTPAWALDDGRPLRERVIDAICTVFDPEIPVNIWELGLIYKLDVDDDGNVAIDMTLTSPACPVAESLPNDVQSRVAQVAGVEKVALELVWEPTWSMEKLSDAARLQLGLM